MHARLFSLLLFLVLCGCQTPPQRVYHPGEGIPFSYENGLIWVEVEAGRHRLQGLLDSGAGSTVLNRHTAQKLGLREGEALPVYGVHSVGQAHRVSGFEGRLGGVPLKSEVYAVDLHRPALGKRRQFDAIIGYDFFAGRIVEIDFQRQRIFLRDQAPNRPGVNSLPMRRSHDTVSVPVSVNGLPVEWTRLDTGCVTPLEWGARFRQEEGDRQPMRRDLVATVRLGSRVEDGVLVGVHPKPLFHQEAGLLGNGLLSRYRVTIDSRAMRLYLEAAR